MAERAVRLRWIMRIPDQPRELQSDLDFEIDGNGRRVIINVVRVVGQGEDLRGETGQQHVRHHVTEIARTVKRH